jgi:hypothetical protein
VPRAGAAETLIAGVAAGDRQRNLRSDGNSAARVADAAGRADAGAGGLRGWGSGSPRPKYPVSSGSTGLPQNLRAARFSTMPFFDSTASDKLECNGERSVQVGEPRFRQTADVVGQD